MTSKRRGFLHKIAATGIGTGAAAQVVGASPKNRVDVRRALRMNPTINSIVDSDSKKVVHNSDAGKDPDTTELFNFAFAGSTVKILDVFKTDTYGWQAYVGVTGSSATRNYNTRSADYQPKTWDKIARNRWSIVKWVNGDSSYDEIDPEDGYRGFYPKGGSDPILPGWVEPAFKTSVGLVLTAARVNPYTSAAATIAFGADTLLGYMAKEDGEKNISKGGRSGIKVQYDEDMYGQEWWSVRNQEMGHYDRVQTRMGDPKGGVDLHVTSKHNDGLGDSWGSNYDVYLWSFEDGGSVTSAGTNTLNRTFTEAEKEKYGIVDVSGGQVDDPQVRTTSHLQARVRRLAEETDGELTKIALNPPTKIRGSNV